jgi:hypothetical protein
MMQKKLLVPAAAVAVLAAGYFGLCAYASNQAQKRLDDFVYDNQLNGTISWASVSSSPLGGKVVIKGVELGDGKAGGLRADKVTLTDLINDDSRTRVRIQATGVQASNGSLQSLQSLGAMASIMGMGGGLRSMNNFGPLLSSGRNELKPFDFMLSLDLDDDATRATGETFVDMPDLFTFSASYRVDNVKGLHRLVNDLQRGGKVAAYAGLGVTAQSLHGAFARAELSELKVSFQDKGMVKRSALLHQRYATPLDPTAGSADKQRQAWFERSLDNWQKSCESGMRANASMLSDGCELMVKLFKGKNDGIQLSIDPKDPVRVMDLVSVFGGGNSRQVLVRMDPKVSSL